MITILFLAIKFIFSAIFSVYSVFVFYLAIMALKRARDAGTLTNPQKVLGYPILAIGWPLDVIFNITWGSLLFLEFPNYKRLSLSARMAYLAENDTGWRGKLSLWFLVNTLDNIDPSGKHAR